MPYVIALPENPAVQVVEKTMDFSTASYQVEDRGRLYTFSYGVPNGDFSELGYANPVLLMASYRTIGAGHETVASTRDIEVIEYGHSWNPGGWANGFYWSFWIPTPWHFEELPRLRALFTFGDRVFV